METMVSNLFKYNPINNFLSKLVYKTLLHKKAKLINGEEKEDLKYSEEDLIDSVAVSNSNSNQKYSMQDEYPSNKKKPIAELAKKSIYDS